MAYSIPVATPVPTPTPRPKSTTVLPSNVCPINVSPISVTTPVPKVKKEVLPSSTPTGGGSRGTTTPSVSVPSGSGDDYLRAIDELARERSSAEDAMAEAQRRAAEAKYGGIMEALRIQKESIPVTAQESREQARERQTFYTGRIEGRKQEELGEIERQRERSERDFLAEKDTLAQNWRELTRLFEAQARAKGIPTSSWMMGEQRKLLMDFNTNIAKASIKYRDLVGDLDEAVRKTINTYNNQIKEIEFQTNEELSKIDAWERNSIAAIRAQEAITLGEKLEQMEQIIAQAEQRKSDIEAWAKTRKADFALWLNQISVTAALSAKYAAQDKIDSAKDSLSTIKNLFQIANLTAQGLRAGDVVKDEKSGYYYYRLVNPTTGQAMDIPLTSNEEQARQLQNLLVSPLEKPLSQGAIWGTEAGLPIYPSQVAGTSATLRY